MKKTFFSEKPREGIFSFFIFAVLLAFLDKLMHPEVEWYRIILFGLFTFILIWLFALIMNHWISHLIKKNQKEILAKSKY